MHILATFIFKDIYIYILGCDVKYINCGLVSKKSLKATALKGAK